MTAIDTIRCSDITDTDAREAGWWTSEDGQREIDMTGATLSEAVREMVDQCGSDEERAAILAGTIQIVNA